MQSTYFLRLSASPLMLPLFLLLSPPLAHSHADAVAEFRSLTISKQRAYTVEKDDVRLGCGKVIMSFQENVLIF